MTSYEHLDVIQHETPNIIEIIFHSNTRAAVDDYVDAMLQVADKLRQEETLDKPLWFLIDVTQSGIYPLQYGRVKIGELVEQLQDIPKAYFAYLVDNAQDRYVIDSYVMTSNPRQQDTRKVFSGAERDKAIDWLTSNTDL